MKSKTFGLDIGTTSIRSVWLGKKGELINLEAIFSGPSVSRALLSESLIDQQSLVENLKSLIKNAQINVSDVNISIPESNTYSKVIEIPMLSEQETAAALKWEMEQYIPLPLDQVKTDWQILGYEEKDQKKTMSVLIVAVPITTIQKYEKILTLAGLIPQAIETEVISVYRALTQVFSKNSSDILVHLGASTSDVAIIRNGIINMVFSIPLGGIAITRAVSLDLGVDANQAENFKKAYGLTENVFEGKVGKALLPILQSLVSDIRKAELSYKEKNQNENIGQIILSGGSALLPGIDVFFANILGTQVVIANCWEINGIKNVPEEIMKDASSYNVVLGLALRDLA